MVKDIIPAVESDILIKLKTDDDAVYSLVKGKACPFCFNQHNNYSKIM